MLKKNLQRQVVGVVKEAYGIWERRAPLAPSHVKQLVSRGWRVQVQPSNRRIYSNFEYAAAGAEITEDLTESTVVLGVKAAPIENLLPNKAYMMFSHTIKAQPENMPLLDACIENNIRLYDYECIARDDQRLVAFGQYAGIVGMADIFQGLGQRLLADGYSTPFLNAPFCYMQPSLSAVEDQVREIGSRIASEGLPKGMRPLVFGFTGGGNVAKGAKGIFELLPFEMIDAANLPSRLAELDAEAQNAPLYRVFGVYLKQSDLVRKKGGGDEHSNRFDKHDYYRNPTGYEPIFHHKVAPYLSVFVNGMYWDPRFPRLLTIQQLQEIVASTEATGQQLRLRAIADVTCDIDGSLEMSKRATSFEQPYLEWDAVKGCEVDTFGSNPNGIMVSTVDILPTGLPREATKHFGDALLPILESCLEHGIPDVLSTACITDGGKLRESYNFIAELRQRAKQMESTEEDRRLTSGTHGEIRAGKLGKQDAHRRVVLAQGHLFDSKFINQAFDEIEKRGHFEILNFFVVPNIDDMQRESQMVIAISAETETTLQSLHDDLVKLGEPLGVRLQSPSHESFLGGGSTQGHESRAALIASTPKVSTSRFDAAPKRVLLLGSGLVAAPLVDYLARDSRETAISQRRHLVVVSDSPEAAQSLAARAPGAATSVVLSIENFARPNESEKSRHLDKLISEADIVVSLLPPPFHAGIAKRCIAEQTHMVTASYVSDDMRELNDSARKAGVILLNEMGLDPGIDHMSAKKIIDEVQEKGGKVRAFSSVCGGLTSPTALDPANPLQYGFSWSPRGVLNAAMTPCRYLRDGQIFEATTSEKLLSAEPFDGWRSLNLEKFANRDSLAFGPLYNIDGEAHTIYRGTLRFQGWCELIHDLSLLGLIDASTAPLVDSSGGTWGQLIGSTANIESKLLSQGASHNRVENIQRTLSYLGALPDAQLPQGSGDAADAFCSLLTNRLSLKPGEHDLIVMHHDFEFEYPDENFRRERHVSSLLAFGDNSATAMAKTVGFTAAIGTDLVLDGFLDKHRGVATPMLREVYLPGLQRLADEGVVFRERSERLSEVRK